MNTSPRTSRAPRWLAMVGILLVVAACSGAATERSATATQASTPTPGIGPDIDVGPDFFGHVGDVDRLRR